MKEGLRRSVALLLCGVLLFFLLPSTPVSAREEDPAEDISGTRLIQAESSQFYKKGLFDHVTTHSVVLKAGTRFLLKSEKGIGSLYFVFGALYGEFTITDPERGAAHTFGQQGFLHEFADIEGTFGYAPRTLELSFPDRDARINELSVFTSGQVPDSVQRWELPVEQETDLLLFPTHGDDEQIFFAGMLPWYAGEKGYQVQVVYLTDHHNNNPKRIHEMLDGLWAVGVRTYPVFGSYGDFYSESLEKAGAIYQSRGISREELLGFVVEQLRRFRPKVAVGHDLAGEYGHGMHMLYADLLCRAVEISDDPTQYPDLAEKYGVWDVPKTYLHLYEKNPVHMNWDIPLEAFDGRTAYAVTRDLGFPCHVSQRSAYAWYFRGSPTAESVDEYSCCDYGLYRTTVGPDVRRDDFFENLTTYAEDAVMVAELVAAEEARQRALAQEQERLRREAEAAEQAEAERKQEKARLERAQLEEEARMQEEAALRQRRAEIALLAAISILLPGITWLFVRRKDGKK